MWEQTNPTTLAESWGPGTQQHPLPFLLLPGVGPLGLTLPHVGRTLGGHRVRPVNPGANIFACL